MEEYLNENQVKRLLKKKGVKGKNYLGNILTLDTETTSLDQDGEKYGICYIWMLGIDDNVLYGRSLERLKEALDVINDSGYKAVCFIHNFSFDFQFLRNVLDFTNVFAREKRFVIRANYKNIEFRCSYALSNMSLDEIGEKYGLNNRKLHDYDYEKIRHEESPMSERELEYCEHDCLVLYEYIKKMLEIYGNYNNLPLTFTGETRKEMKDFITNNYEGHRKDFALKDWKRFVNKMTPTIAQFEDLVRCFGGGYVHANPAYSCKTIENVHSVDFTSSYIYCMFEKFPMGRFYNDYETTLDNLDIENKAYILTLKLNNVTSKELMNFISFSKIDIHKSHGFITDNGRILSAECIVITCNEHDYLNILDCYDIESIELLKCRSCKKDYLPKVFLEFVKSVYLRKQALKPFKEEKPMEYQRAKSSLNSIYGMMITNVIGNNIEYSDEWKSEEPDREEIEKMLDNMWKNETNLLPYCWGCWVASAARRNIYKNICKFDTLDVVYSDTDSIKYVGNKDKIIDEYNKECEEKIKKCCKSVGIDYTGLLDLGKFDREEDSEKFRTIGAKKYITEKKDGLHLTLSGVSKKQGVKALKSIEDFKPGFIFDSKYTGKKGKFYNDEQPNIKVTDYLGNTITVKQKYGVCLFPIEYRLDITFEYDQVIKSYSNSKYLMNL